LILLLLSPFALPNPPGPTLISNNTEEPSVRPALMLNTTGGSVTTMVLNGTTQNLGWKAYVGNISGNLVLKDADNYSVFEWDLTTVTGEIYATRESTNVDWSSLTCAQAAQVGSEEAAMNQDAADVDSISNTFINTTHSEFYTAGIHFSTNQCNYTTATYISSAKQYDHFQEVLLYDSSYLVYTTLLENSSVGFDTSRYDFQMLVAEDDTTTVNTAYYFYVELG